ncbi:MAG: thioredoxin family protein [Rhodoferax sp.]|nr:thioredoxin family protein [Rhodoferax sp.]
MKWIAFVLSFFVSVSALAADPAYDEQADANKEIQQALLDAAKAKVPVILIFGANWCPDCRVLDTAMKSGAAAPLMARDFRVVKINVGRFDRNTDIAQAYGVPLKKGIPAVAILSANNEVLYATRSGELADARAMGDSGIHEFLKRAAASTRAGS